LQDDNEGRSVKLRPLVCQVTGNDKIGADAHANANGVLEIDHSCCAGGIVAETVVPRAIFYKRLRQHARSGIVADDCDAILGAALRQIKDRIGGRQVEQLFKFRCGMWQVRVDRRQRLLRARRVGRQDNVWQIAILGEPRADGIGRLMSAFRQRAFMVICKRIIPAGFCVADQDQSFHWKAFIWNAAWAGRR